ncbi:MAG TPA: sigma-70 family RNA polymerase sigma factor [Solirubrobacterales bacterium]|nr:sigma-70 family RNA polymerase sigma factor [Solirubrobacterales bacterium]
METFSRHQASLRRTALRYSLCADDADEALQRGLEILLEKAPSEDPRDLVRWTQTVVKHEALAVRAERERILAGPAAATEPEREDWVAMLPTEADGPAERAERHEAIERSREALATLKPQELRALTLLAEGYSYREISQITGYSATKVNRALAEGRERFRRFLARRDDGARCTELAPLLSAFADGEAGEAEVATLREHLRSCPHCRATLRAYRAAPRAAAALAPALPPLRGSLADRLHDAYAALATRVGGGSGASDSALGGLAAAGGTRGAGMAALAKVLAICAGTVGGAAACVATGVVPAPLLGVPEHRAPAAKVSHHPRRLVDAEVTEPTVDYETEEPGEGEAEPAPQEREAQVERPEKKQKAKEGQPAEPAAASAPPPSESGAIEYTEPAPAPAPTSSAAASSSSASSGSSSAASSGTAAGEFGP